MENRTGIVIGANRDAIHSIQMAQKNGVHIIAVDGNPDAEGFAYADESKVVDISNVDRVAEIVEAVKPDFILPIPIGRYLATMGIINTRYGLKGAGERAVILSTDKYEFHQVLYEAGLRNVKAFLVNEDTQLSQIANIPFPVLFKPRYGSGSRDIFFANNEQELKESYQKVIQKREDFVLEQMVEGTEYGVDGAVIDGKLFITLLREKMLTPLPVRQAVAYFSVPLDGDNRLIINRIRAYMSKVVKLLHYNDCLFHADIIISSDQEFLIEMAPRPSGHNLHNVFVPLAVGIDLAEEYIHFLLGKEYHFVSNTIRRLQIRFFDMENVKIAGVPSENTLRNNPRCNLVMWNCNIRKGDRMNKVSDGHSIMDRGFFIVEGESRADLVTQSEWILSQFQYEEAK